MSQTPPAKPLPVLAHARPEAQAVINPPWTDADVQALRDYISRNGNFLAYLAARAPKVETGSLEQAALTGARHAGFEDLFNVLVTMATTPNVAEQSPFIGNDDAPEAGT